MATSELLEDLQSIRERLNQLPSIKDNELLIVTTSTVVGKVRAFCEALPQGDILQKLVLKARPTLIDVVSSTKEIALGKGENRRKLDEAARRLSGILTDVESVWLDERADVHDEEKSAEEMLAHYRTELETRRERIGQTVEETEVESALSSSWEKFSAGVDSVRKALAQSCPERDDVTRSSAEVAKAVCSLLDVTDTLFHNPHLSRSEVHRHTTSVIRIAKDYVLDVEEMKSVVSLLHPLAKSLTERCKEHLLQYSAVQITHRVEQQQSDAIEKGDVLVTVWNETGLGRSPMLSRAKALYDFDMGEKEENLRFFKGDVIQVIKKNQSGWWEGRVGTNTGVFPASFVLELTDEMSSLSPTAQPATQGTASDMTSLLRNPQSLSSDQDGTDSPKNRCSSAESRKSKLPQAGLQSASDSQLLLEKAPPSATARRVYTWGGEDESKLTQPVHKEGIMKKEGGHHKSWKTRWFILDHEKICYYKPSQLKSPMGTIHLRDYNFAAVTGDRPDHPNSFNLCGDSVTRVFFFSASSREEMNDWIVHINRGIKQRKKSLGQLPVLEESTRPQFEGSVSEVAAAECIEYLLNEDRIRQEGLFRVPGNAKKVKHYLEAVDQGTLPLLDDLHSPHTVASVLKKLFKEQKVKMIVVSSVAKELLQVVEMKCSPPTARSLLIGIHGFRLLGGLIHLFSEVLASQTAGKSSVTVDDLARSFGIYMFEDLNVGQAVVVLDFLLRSQSEVLA